MLIRDPVVTNLWAIWNRFGVDLGVPFGSLFCLSFMQFLDCVVFAEFARRQHESTIIEVPVSQKTLIVGSMFDYIFGHISGPPSGGALGHFLELPSVSTAGDADQKCENKTCLGNQFLCFFYDVFN